MYLKRIHLKNEYHITSPLADAMFETILKEHNIGYEKFEFIGVHTVDVWFNSKEDYFLYQLHR